MRALVIVLLLFCACKPSSKGQTQYDDALQKIVKQEIGEKSATTKNNSKTFALAYLEQEGNTHYIIIRLSDNKVVTKEKIRGTVSWVSDMQIKEMRTPGIVKKDYNPEDYSKVIDLNKYIVQTK
ncbi:MAG: hypothetical protein HYR67_11890 [Bacteroidetes bacterium]|nr:hypothetical protein [Bacteroidota bacterium]